MEQAKQSHNPQSVMKEEDNLPGNATARKFFIWLLRLLMKLLLRFEISNTENIPPPTRPLIIIINHIALLDPVMVLGGFPRTVFPMAKKETFDLPILGSLTSLYGAIPVRRGEGDIKAIKSALKVLKQGGVVLLAPEGTRSPTYQMQFGKEGAAMLALRSGATILPIGITGTHRVKAHWRNLGRPPVHLAVGVPFRLQPVKPSGRTSREELEAMTHEMMYRLAALLPQEFRGVYENLDNASGFYLSPVEGWTN